MYPDLGCLSTINKAWIRLDTVDTVYLNEKKKKTKNLWGSVYSVTRVTAACKKVLDPRTEVQ